MALTPEQIKELRAKAGIPEQGLGAVQVSPEDRIARLRAGTSLTAQPQEDKLLGSKTLGDVAKGVGKGELSTFKGLGSLGQGILDTVFPQFKKTTPEADIYRKETETGQKATEALTPKGTAESVGFGAEKLAEFFIPASKAAQAEKSVNLLAEGIKNPLFASAARIAGKGAVQAVSAGGVALAQTGSPKEAAKTAAFAGGTRAGLAVIGEGARALKIPERLYSLIFKNNFRDMKSQMTSETLLNIQKNDPQKYAELVKEGIINTKNGAPVLNETLAKQALDAGLKGNTKTMANEVINGSLDSELAVRKIARDYAGSVDLSEEQFLNVIKEISQEYENVGFGEISNEATKLANTIQSTGGKVDAVTALDVRRLLDKARIASSFEKPASKLSLTQANLKTLADAARGRINSIPGMGEAMKQYSFYIDALEALSKEASRAGNRQVVSLIDSLFLTGVAASDSATLGAMAVLRKLTNTPSGATNLAQFIQGGTLGAKGSTLLEAGSRGLQSATEDQ